MEEMREEHGGEDGLLSNAMDDKGKISKGNLQKVIKALGKRTPDNAEMIAMYWEIGTLIYQCQQEQGWGTGFIPKLAKDLKNELPEIKGFSESNLGYMVQFVKEYPEFSILQRPVAKFPEPPIEQVSGLDSAHAQLSVHEMPFHEKIRRLIPQIGWAHHILLMQKVKDLPTRLWYMEQSIEELEAELLGDNGES
jgi:predicted nuclease of restriction endonuclease-like (RecB) superfamily